ncbi:MAG: restriction endonuclease subunit S [Anaerolineales bacterium]
MDQTSGIKNIDACLLTVSVCQSHFERIAPQSSQKNINIGILESVNDPVPPLDEQGRIVACLDGFPLTRDLRQARLASLRQLQSASGEELRPLFGRTLLPSVLPPSGGAFKGKL